MSKGNDKKEYADMMKIMDAEASISSTLNKLGQIAIDSEDEKLKAAAAGLASRLRSFLGPKPSGKGRLLTMANAVKNSHDVQKKQFGEGILQVWKYCKEMSERQEPQWQILVKRAGWTPPASR